MSSQAGRNSGLLDSVRRVGATLVEIVHTRLELLVTELEEERMHIARALWLAAIGGFFLAVSTLLVVVFVVALFWDSYRLLAVGVLAFGFGAAGFVLLIAVRNLVTERKRLFAQSLEELRSDREHLSK